MARTRPPCGSRTATSAPEKGDAYVGSAGHEITVRLEPGDLRVWDFADEHEAMDP